MKPRVKFVETREVLDIQSEHLGSGWRDGPWPHIFSKMPSDIICVVAVHTILLIQFFNSYPVCPGQ